MDSSRHEDANALGRDDLRLARVDDNESGPGKKYRSAVDGVWKSM